MKFLMAILSLSMSTTAALKWEQQTVSIKVHPTQSTAAVEFKFSNTGRAPVRIVSVDASCGCLVPKVEKKSIVPGEQGELVINFDLRNRYGPQEKAVLVQTDDGKKISLSIKTDIPKSYTVAPMLMKWAADNQQPVKTVRLTNNNTFPIQLMSVMTSDDKVSAKLKVIRAGFEYELIVHRPAAGNKTRSVVRIKMEPPPGETESKDLKLYVLAE